MFSCSSYIHYFTITLDGANRIRFVTTLRVPDMHDTIQYDNPIIYREIELYEYNTC